MTNANQDLAQYSVTDARIAELREQYLDLTIEGLDDKHGIEVVTAAHQEMKALRLDIEDQRAALKAPHLEAGRAIDRRAKEIQAAIEPIESHLKGERDRIAEAKAKIKAEKAARRREILDKRMAKLAEVRSATLPGDVEPLTVEQFAELLEAETAANGVRLAEEKAEADRIAAEKAKAEAEAKAAREKEEAERKAERERLEAQRRVQAEKEAELAAERKALDGERRAAEEKLKAEREALEAEKKAARDAVEANIRAEQEAREAADREERRKAMAPAVEQIEAFAAALESLLVPEVPGSEDIERAVGICATQVRSIGKGLVR